MAVTLESLEAFIAQRTKQKEQREAAEAERARQAPEAHVHPQPECAGRLAFQEVLQISIGAQFACARELPCLLCLHSSSMLAMQPQLIGSHSPCTSGCVFGL